jgi:hypothetical protein
MSREKIRKHSVISVRPPGGEAFSAEVTHVGNVTDAGWCLITVKMPDGENGFVHVRRHEIEIAS